MSAATQVEAPVHDLIFRDSFFRCTCSTIHQVKDIDDARVAHAAHVSAATGQPARDDSEPATLAEIRARKSAATQGPLTWVGNDLEGARGAAVMESSVNCGSYCYGGSPSMEMPEGDKAFFETAQVDVSVAVAGLDAVIELHKPQARQSGGVQRRICAECSRGLPGQGSNSVVLWPCRTFTALRNGMASELKAILERDPYADTL
jgi:hypothetical protein